jgi:hypothetical protein
VPASASIGAGAATTFAWTYSSVGSGNVSFSTRAVGVDANSLLPVSSTTSASPAVQIQSPAQLLITSLDAQPSTVGTGGSFTAILTVQNTGEAGISGLSVPTYLNLNDGGAGLAITSSVATPSSLASLAGGASAAAAGSLQDHLDQVERQAILDALRQSNNNRTAAARLLGVTFRSLRYRMARLGLNE